MTTPDGLGTEARLEMAREAHHGDAEAYAGLGKMFRARRRELPPRYWNNRNKLARERLMPLGLGRRAAEQLLNEVENGAVRGERMGLPMETLVMLAIVYEVDPASIADALDGKADALAPAPEPPAQLRPGERADGASIAAFPGLAAVPPRALRATPEIAAATEPWRVEALGAVIRAQQKLGPGEQLDGRKVFPAGRDDPAAADYARAWDVCTAFAPDPVRTAEYWAVWRAWYEQQRRDAGRPQASPPG